MKDLDQARDQMVEQQLKSRGISDEAVLSAMREVPREEFVKSDMVEYAYDDSALPIDEGQTISQPYIVALMAQAIEPEPEDRVLDIGTGSGYAAAVVSKIVDEVYTIERHQSLSDTAAERFKDLGYHNIHVQCGDGSTGWAEHAPYDGIMVAAGGPEIPDSLRNQLAVGGHLIIPVGDAERVQRLRKITKTGEDTFEEESLGRVRFVPLVGEEGWASEESNGNDEFNKSLDNPGRAFDSLEELITYHAEPFLEIEVADIDPLIERIKDAKVVLMGEASHGTAEFYEMRARISKELITNHGFNIVAAEADWPDAEHINAQIRPTAPEPTTETPFTRFPTWMWKNREFLNFVEWMRDYNQETEKPEEEVGFYGLDLYSLYSSIDTVITYLEDVDEALAEEARVRYGCLSPWERDPQQYGAATLSGRYPDCEADVVQLLEKIMNKRMELISSDGERYHSALQSAKVVADAEKYYRAMYYGARSSWNIRDQHMFETLENLLEYRGPGAKAIVWAHNSHVGDASATEFSADGKHNIGQLSKQLWGDEAQIIGFGTHQGTVAAADNWDGPLQIKDVRPSLERSYEQLFHDSGIDQFVLPLRAADHKQLHEALQEPRLERAIGVIYRPQTELQSHYFQASLSRQFDEYIWFDESRALTPYHQETESEAVPETFPFGT